MEWDAVVSSTTTLLTGANDGDVNILFDGHVVSYSFFFECLKERGKKAPCRGRNAAVEVTCLTHGVATRLHELFNNNLSRQNASSSACNDTVDGTYGLQILEPTTPEAYFRRRNEPPQACGSLSGGHPEEHSATARPRADGFTESLLINKWTYFLFPTCCYTVFVIFLLLYKIAYSYLFGHLCMFL